MATHTRAANNSSYNPGGPANRCNLRLQNFSGPFGLSFLGHEISADTQHWLSFSGKHFTIWENTFCYFYIKMVYQYKNSIPVVHPTAFVHPQAAVTGKVQIGKNVYIGPGAAIRGDFGVIIIADGCNVQENCTIHMFPGTTVILHENVHIGHGAIVHGAIIGRNCLVGMNAVIMDNVEIGDNCIIGALSLVKAGEKIPPRSVMAGNPARLIRQVSDEMLAWKTEGTRIYQQLAADMQEHWKPCEPLRELPADFVADARGYKPWDEVKNKDH